jgi:hypothetical protein
MEQGTFFAEQGILSRIQGKMAFNLGPHLLPVT